MSAPWEDDAAKRDNRAAGMLGFGIVCVASGATALGVGIGVVNAKSNLELLTDAWLAGGGSGGDFGVKSLLGSVLAGAVVIVFGLLSLVAFWRRSRVASVICLTFVLGLSVIQIGGPLLFNNTLAKAKRAVETKPAETTYDADELAMINFGLVVHRRCCHEKYANDPNIPASFRSDVQKPVPECPDSNEVCINELPGVAQSIPGNSILCQCFTSDVFSPIDNHVNKTGLCEKLTSINVPVGPKLEVPVIGVGLFTTISAATDKYDDYFPINDFSMTGQVAPRDPPSIEVNGERVPTPPDQGVEGFNCGLGYAKGPSWIQYLYLQNVGGTPAVVCIAAGGVQALGVLLVLAFWMLGGGSQGDDWIDYDRHVAPKAPEV